MRKPPHPRSDVSIRAIASYRGSQSGYKYAESFQTIYSSKI